MLDTGFPRLPEVPCDAGAWLAGVGPVLPEGASATVRAEADVASVDFETLLSVVDPPHADSPTAATSQTASQIAPQRRGRSEVSSSLVPMAQSGPEASVAPTPSARAHPARPIRWCQPNQGRFHQMTTSRDPPSPV